MVSGRVSFFLVFLPLQPTHSHKPQTTTHKTLSEDSSTASDTDRMEEEEFFGLLPRMVAVKVVKNKPAYFNQAKVEIKVLKKVGDDLGPGNDPRIPGSTIIRLLHDFEYHHHLCLVFELMSVNLYELIKHQEFRGLPLATVRMFSAQLLDALVALCFLGVVHCDLKPENVLLENFGDPSHPRIKLIDLGSACYQVGTNISFSNIPVKSGGTNRAPLNPMDRIILYIPIFSLAFIVPQKSFWG